MLKDKGTGDTGSPFSVIYSLMLRNTRFITTPFLSYEVLVYRPRGYNHERWQSYGTSRYGPVNIEVS